MLGRAPCRLASKPWQQPGAIGLCLPGAAATGPKHHHRANQIFKPASQTPEPRSPKHGANFTSFISSLDF
jgi:hypothetical protein